jgi:ferric-dicitrate binding protein FerR (iron transport regulator)
MNEKLKLNLQKYFAGGLSLREQIELSEQLADTHNADSENLLLDEWAAQLENGDHSHRNFRPILDRVHHHIRLNENGRVIKFNVWQAFQKIAAILILPLLFSFLAYLYFHTKGVETGTSYAEIQCPMGVRTKFCLPDGSSGFLNSGSTLKYPVVFANARSVELTGEAFFDVTHNKELPFHVNTKNLDIKVLGTTFNVIANDDEETEEVILQSGKVDVSSRSGNLLAVLTPNEQLTLNADKQTFSKSGVIASQYVSWKEGKLVFRNEKMEQVAKRLSRWYNAEVVIADPMLEPYTFHATFIDEPLDEVLKLLSVTTPILFKEEKRTSDQEGLFQRRRILLQINKLKINQFR